jgi:hypothetical protein
LAREVGDDPGESLLVVVESYRPFEEEADRADDLSACSEGQSKCRLDALWKERRAVRISCVQRRSVWGYGRGVCPYGPSQQRGLTKLEPCLLRNDARGDSGEIDDDELFTLHDADRHSVGGQDPWRVRSERPGDVGRRERAGERDGELLQGLEFPKRQTRRVCLTGTSLLAHAQSPADPGDDDSDHDVDPPANHVLGAAERDLPARLDEEP